MTQQHPRAFSTKVNKFIAPRRRKCVEIEVKGMAQARIHDGLRRLVEHFLSNQDEVSKAQILEVCERLLQRYKVEDQDLTVRDDDGQETVKDVEHISELIKRKCMELTVEG